MTPDKVEAALGVLRAVANVRKWWLTPWSDGGGNDSPKSALSNFTEASQGIEEAISVLTEALAERGWRPIESAPRDGSCVLLADADSVTPGFYHDGSECYGHRGGAGFFDESDRGSLLTASNFHATHWQPLPEPPHAR